MVNSKSSFSIRYYDFHLPFTIYYLLFTSSLPLKFWRAQDQSHNLRYWISWLIQLLEKCFARFRRNVSADYCVHKAVNSSSFISGMVIRRISVEALEIYACAGNPIAC